MNPSESKQQIWNQVMGESSTMDTLQQYRDHDPFGLELLLGFFRSSDELLLAQRNPPDQAQIGLEQALMWAIENDEPAFSPPHILKVGLWNMIMNYQNDDLGRGPMTLLWASAFTNPVTDYFENKMRFEEFRNKVLEANAGLKAILEFYIKTFQDEEVSDSRLLTKLRGKNLKKIYPGYYIVALAAIASHTYSPEKDREEGLRIENALLQAKSLTELGYLLHPLLEKNQSTRSARRP